MFGDEIDEDVKDVCVLLDCVWMIYVVSQLEKE